MQQMQSMLRVYGSVGSGQRLRQHLTAEDMFGIVILTAKKVLLDGFDVYKVEYFLQDRIVHGCVESRFAPILRASPKLRRNYCDVLQSASKN